MGVTENSSEVSNSQSVRNGGTTSASVAPGSFMTPGVRSQETIAARNAGLDSIEELAHVSLVKQQYYPNVSDGEAFPGIMGIGFVNMSVDEKGLFALAIYADPGVLSLCDPYSL